MICFYINNCSIFLSKAQNNYKGMIILIKKNYVNKLIWNVKIYDTNSNEIKDYNILSHRLDLIKKFKKISKNKNEFAEKLKRDLMWQYWSRCEYELIIETTEDNHILLKPWVGCSNPDNIMIDVTEDKEYDWQGFAKEHINKQIYKNSAKIDCYDQIIYKDQFKKLVDYCWHTRLKYERYDSKFEKYWKAE